MWTRTKTIFVKVHNRARKNDDEDAIKVGTDKTQKTVGLIIARRSR